MYMYILHETVEHYVLSCTCILLMLMRTVHVFPQSIYATLQLSKHVYMYMHFSPIWAHIRAKEISPHGKGLKSSTNLVHTCTCTCTCVLHCTCRCKWHAWQDLLPHTYIYVYMYMLGNLTITLKRQISVWDLYMRIMWVKHRSHKFVLHKFILRHTLLCIHIKC